MLTYYFSCYKKPKQKPKLKPKLKRENTPYPKQSVIDIDNGSIDQIEITSNFDNIEHEYLHGTGILHVYKQK